MLDDIVSKGNIRMFVDEQCAINCDNFVWYAKVTYDVFVQEIRYNYSSFFLYENWLDQFSKVFCSCDDPNVATFSKVKVDK